MQVKAWIAWISAAAVACAVAWWMQEPAQAQAGAAAERALQEARNLGKAFYETPGSSQLAVEQLEKALELNPGSAREHLNFGLALLRAGRREEGVEQLVAAQKLDRTIPHTYFNLGVEYKKAGEVEKSIDQFLQMEKLVPDEAKTQYNLGALYKQIGNIRRAIQKFERTVELDPSLAAPHFQLFGILRRTDSERAMRELETFKSIKEATEDAAVGEDVDWSFYAELYDQSLATGAAAPAVPFSFEVRKIAQLVSGAVGALSLDANGDGLADALVWSAQDAVVALARSEAGPSQSGLELPGAVSYAAGDFDGDGMADLCRVDEGGVQVLLNRSGRSFEADAYSPGDFNLCLFADYDHDSDFDLFALGEDRRLLQNDGEGGLTDVTARFPFASGPVRAASFAELFEDNGQDFIAVYGNGVAVHQDRKLGLYGEASLVDGVVVPDGPSRLDVIDTDHDQFLDVAVTAGERTALLENQGGELAARHAVAEVAAWGDFQLRGRFDAASGSGFLVNREAFELESASSSPGLPEGVAVAGDFDADGKPDLMVAAPDGSVSFAANRTQTEYHGLTVRLEGVKSPKIATQARVEVKAGLSYAKQVYQGVPLHFGLGRAAAFDTVRVTWANGLIQNEMPEEPVSELAVKEAPRLSGSCPMVFTWNGSKFEYIGEVLGVAPLGASLARGVYFPVDHDEYISVGGDQLRERDGYLDVRLTEELREAAYIDMIRLVAVDHLDDMAVLSNEKAKGPPFPEFRLFGVRSRIRPVAASNQRGEDVLARLSASDRRYPPVSRDFRNRAERHSLTLDFPAFDDDDAVLFLEGWVDWSSASSIVAASQTAQSAVMPPLLQVQDDSGRWMTVVADVGLPGGTVRTIAVDLSGKFPGRSRKVRIVSNMSVYWDAAYVGLDSSRPRVRLTRLVPSVANLRFRGFSRNHVAEGRLQPERFDYHEVSATSNWNPTPGLYTRFGDVRELLFEEDDRIAIMGAGDEIELRFRAGGLPQLPEGWRRDFLLLVDGWAKENEPNTAFGDTVAPLPFHAMSGYPYRSAEAYPRTPEHQADLLRYHTRPAMRLIRPLVAGRLRR